MNNITMSNFPIGTNHFGHFVIRNENVTIDLEPDEYEVINSWISTTIRLYFINRDLREELRPFVDQTFSIIEVRGNKEFYYSNMKFQCDPSFAIKKNENGKLESRAELDFYRLK